MTWPRLTGLRWILCKLGFALEQEDDAAGFLGVKFDRDSETGMVEMKQTGLVLILAGSIFYSTVSFQKLTSD